MIELAKIPNEFGFFKFPMFDEHVKSGIEFIAHQLQLDTIQRIRHTTAWFSGLQDRIDGFPWPAASCTI